MKTTISVTIDTDVIIKARKEIKNLSKFFEDQLRKELDM